MPHLTESRQRRRNHKHTRKNIRRRRAEAKYVQIHTTPSFRAPPRFRHGRALKDTDEESWDVVADDEGD